MNVQAQTPKKNKNITNVVFQKKNDIKQRYRNVGKPSEVHLQCKQMSNAYVKKSHSAVLQLAKLENKSSSGKLETPMGSISKYLGLPGTKLNLPGSQPVNDLERAESVYSLVDSTSLRDTERSKSNNLSKVTTMARAEQFILQGADMKKYYDAGHLIADQLIGGKFDSFVMCNLAPQVSDFNAPTYAQMVEEDVKEVASGSEVEIEVRVGYSDSYSVSIGKIIERGIAKPDYQDQYKATFNKKEFNLDEKISIPRRIPHSWNFHSEVKTKDKYFPAKEKQAGWGGYAKDIVTDVDLQKLTPTIGDPFKFGMYNWEYSRETAGKVILKAARIRSMSAKQWVPNEKLEKDDVHSLLTKVFPDIGGGWYDTFMGLGAWEEVLKPILNVTKRLYEFINRIVNLGKNGLDFTKNIRIKIIDKLVKKAGKDDFIEAINEANLELDKWEEIVGDEEDRIKEELESKEAEKNQLKPAYKLLEEDFTKFIIYMSNRGEVGKSYIVKGLELKNRGNEALIDGNLAEALKILNEIDSFVKGGIASFQ